MRFDNLYHRFKPYLPRPLQMAVRRKVALWRRLRNRESWPIDGRSGQPPPGWLGWPEGKRFALVLTHDVESEDGQGKCCSLAEMEERRGLRSSFNFVAEKYRDNPLLRGHLVKGGFEVGVHGLTHDGSLFHSRRSFLAQAPKINRYLREWGAVGFRAPCMYHRLDWMHDLEIEYDASTFDTDPFEPQPDGVGTIFPFTVENGRSGQSYTELPYTLPQDFTLFGLLGEKGIEIWRQKLDWIAQSGGMALLNVHPDYMTFGQDRASGECYPVSQYLSFLDYVQDRYAGSYWHGLPREVARFWRAGAGAQQGGEL